MREWIITNQKQLGLLVILIFILLTVFYFNLYRPLTNELAVKTHEVESTQHKIIEYENLLEDIREQELSEIEKKNLYNAVPAKVNVEYIIKELEKTEMETGTKIENIVLSNFPNNYNEEEQLWTHLLSESTLSELESRIETVQDLTVSYVELDITLTGKKENVYRFIHQLENLQRIIHIQSFSYDSVDLAQNELRSNITIRAFYTNDFIEFIDSENFNIDFEHQQTIN